MLWAEGRRGGKKWSTKLRRYFGGFTIAKVRRRLRMLHASPNWSYKYLLPGHVWLDKIDIVVTTKCNLLCEDCCHLMPYYKTPYHLDRELLIASMHKLNESFDWCDHYNLLGGEPFLNPELKYFIEEAPSERCNLIQIITNATVIPDDPELFDVMRRKKVLVVLSDYPSNQKTQKELISVLERERVAYNVYSPQWTYYGPPVDHHRSQRDLKKQFNRCSAWAKILLNGKLYYCFRCGHCDDLGFCGVEKGEYIDLLNNTTAENQKQLARLLWRLKPTQACQYCLRSTEENVAIPQGR